MIGVERYGFLDGLFGIFLRFATHIGLQCTPMFNRLELRAAVSVGPKMPKHPKPDGRYSLVYEPEAVDAWDAITAVETPDAIENEPEATKKRSGEYVKAAFADAVRQTSRP